MLRPTANAVKVKEYSMKNCYTADDTNQKKNRLMHRKLDSILSIEGDAQPYK